MEPDRLSRELAEKLEAARMTAEALSLSAQLARDTVGRWMRGTTVPTLAALQEVESVLSSRLSYAVDLSAAVRERRAARQSKQPAPGDARRVEIAAYPHSALTGQPGYWLKPVYPTHDEPILVPGSQRGPSFLLHPHRQVVPFQYRPTEQDRLTEWRDSPDPVSVLLLSAPGGHGKTRLASFFARDSQRNGWAVAAAVEGPASPGYYESRGLALNDDMRMLVVDYAERWPLAPLLSLITSLRESQKNRRLRVLLVARPQAAWWESVRAELEGQWIDYGEPLILGDFTVPGEERRRAFAEAAEAFAACIEVNIDELTIPLDIDHESYASPLTLHMAALAAVCGGQESDMLPRRTELSHYLLGHEQRYWNRAATPAVSTDMIRRAVFVATLFGPVSEAQAGALLHRAHLADTDSQVMNVIKTHERLYPPPNTSTTSPFAAQADEFLQPLVPDRLGEDFLVEELTGIGVPTLLRHLLSAPITEPDIVGMRHCLSILIAGASRHEVLRAALFDQLARQPTLALYGTPGLIELVVSHAPDELAASLAAVFPDSIYDNVDPSAVALTTRAVDSLPRDAPPSLRARLLHRLSAQLWTRRHPGYEVYPGSYTIFYGAGGSYFTVHPGRNILVPLELINEAIVIYRQLAESQPAFIPELASALAKQSTYLAVKGESSQALRAAREAVSLYGTLTSTYPELLPAYALALRRLANLYSASEDFSTALEEARAAVGIVRRLSDLDTAYQTELAHSLKELGVHILNADGDQREMLALSREAIDIRRRTAIDRLADLLDLAQLTRAYGTIRVHLGLELPEALAAVNELINSLGQRILYLGTEPAFVQYQLQHVKAEILDGLGKHEEAAELRYYLDGDADPSWTE